MKLFKSGTQQPLLKMFILTVIAATIISLITEHVEAPREAVNLFPRPAGARRPLSLYAVGNINLAGVETQSWFGEGSAPGFAALLRELATADLAFGNLECQLVKDQPGEGKLRHFSASPEAAAALASAGFDFLSTANEIASEFDAQALGETIAGLRRVGVRHAGTGRTIDEAYAPAVIERQGWRIALFAVTAHFNRNYFGLPTQSILACANITQLTRQIMLARHRFDLILVSYHGGDAAGAAPTDEARYFARRCVEAGADIILGHHPRAPQAIELYRQRLIFYSLGDFIGGAEVSASREDQRGLAARITVRNGEASNDLKFEVERVPLVNDPLPRRAEGEAAREVLDLAPQISDDE
jgi:poly-gamma-glutamate synthesis protein (capsule biosynthesis protein)